MNTDTAINSNTNKKDEHVLSGIKFIQTDNKLNFTIISSSYLFLKDKSFVTHITIKFLKSLMIEPKMSSQFIPWQNFSEMNRGENELVL